MAHQGCEAGEGQACKPAAFESTQCGRPVHCHGGKHEGAQSGCHPGAGRGAAAQAVRKAICKCVPYWDTLPCSILSQHISSFQP